MEGGTSLRGVHPSVSPPLLPPVSNTGVTGVCNVLVLLDGRKARSVQAPPTLSSLLVKMEILKYHQLIIGKWITSLVDIITS